MSRSDDMQQLIDSEKARAQEIIEANLRNLVRTGAVQARRPRKAGVRGRLRHRDGLSGLRGCPALEASRQLVTVRPSSRIRDRVVGPP